MAGQARIVLIEDTHSIAAVYAIYLEPLGQVTTCHSAAEAKAAISQQPPDLVILDLNLPDQPGQEVLQWIKANYASEVIIVTAHGSVDIAMEMMRIGASDFLEKPVSADRLRTTARICLENNELRNTVKAIKKTLARDHYHGFVGASMPIQAVYKTIDAAAPSKATVFITGESGTGKEVCAEAIKIQSPRSGKPFVAINCGAIPRDLIESELFGHIKGAFTGAHSERKGAILEAHEGTLFLDEIGEMPLDLQTKLLRFLQNGEVQKVGSSKVQKVDVRVICATNRDPFEEVQAGRFREDLYYRLNVLPIELPPLRERGSDIVLLAENFLRKFAKEEGKSFQNLSAKVEQVLCHYPWPGNVRQLQNVIRNIVVLHTGEIVLPEHLPAPLNHPKWQKGLTAIETPTQEAAPAATQQVQQNHHSLQSNPNAQPIDHLGQGRATATPYGQAQNGSIHNGGPQNGLTNGTHSPAEAYNTPPNSFDAPPPEQHGIQYQAGFSTDDPSQILTLAEVERRAIEHAIAVAGGNIPKAAALLDVSPSTIYRKKQNWDKTQQAAP